MKPLLIALLLACNGLAGPLSGPPLVLYGRTVKAPDVQAVDALTSTKGDVVAWCNVGDNKPDKLRSWGCKAVVGYVNAGSWEAWRPGAKQFAKQYPKALGKADPGWPDERWLDIRTPQARAYVRAQIVAARSAGFDGVDFDNLNLDQQITGFKPGINRADMANYVQWLITETRALGLAVSLRHMTKPDATPDAWLIEDGIRDKYARDYLPALKAGRAVISLEYGTPKRITSGPSGLWIIFANRNLSRNEFTQLLS